MSRSDFSGRTHTQAQLDAWANQNNPNNPAYRKNADNRSNQLNPNNPEHRQGEGPRGKVSGKTHTKEQLDAWANQNNPNNPAYRANADNRSNQLNPNNPVYREKAEKRTARRKAYGEAYRQTERLISGGAFVGSVRQDNGKNGPGPKGDSGRPSAAASGKPSGKKPTQAQLDARANRNNPNNPDYRAKKSGKTHQQIHNAQRRNRKESWVPWGPDYFDYE